MANPVECSYGVIPVERKNGTWYVFLIQHHAGHWGFPKGHANDLETPEQSAERELIEETNLQIKRFLTEQPFIEEYQFKRSGRTIEKTVLYFLAEVEGTVNLQEEEILAASWVPLDEADEHLTFMAAQEIARKASEILNHFLDRQDIDLKHP